MINFSSLNHKLFKSSFQKHYMSSHNLFPHGPSRFQWKKFKDLMNMYLLISIIPLGGLITYCHIYIGPATLSEIPEDYVPKCWEYYKHPITRFIARYLVTDPQEDYEKYLHHIFEEDEKRRLRALESQIIFSLRDNLDYKSYYYRPVLAKYHRLHKQCADKIAEIMGD
ncbi:NADH dehydrogenase [ubiquinone] 1 beta subcomplex subunit 5, mitochondrial-like [Onthophagus taurus]|uniref:NADH dehydrogenase [ubiquinone] 1 beta subcomplex subunit 5, mitochondrial-like n=1 Tax=Onthophagus taurus TaxID=166361 RepID=UPI0039BE40B8